MRRQLLAMLAVSVLAITGSNALARPYQVGDSVIGPLLIGLDKPAQIAQMGATVSDIANLAALAAHDAIR